MMSRAMAERPYRLIEISIKVAPDIAFCFHMYAEDHRGNRIIYTNS